MSNNSYSKAYTEVLEIISYFSEEELSKIPKEKIEFFEENKDAGYDFKIDPEVDLGKQNISREANAILVGLYRDYFATNHQKDVLDDLLMQNQSIIDREKREKYNPDNIFENKTEQIIESKNESNIFNDEDKDKNKNNETQIVEYKESFWVRFKKFIFRILHIKE